MDIKLQTSEMLLRKLASGCGEVQLQAAAEIRLFAKWDDANRVSLARAGAIAPLIELLDRQAETKLQENAVLALLNLSINAENKVLILREEGSVEAVVRLANEGESAEVKANAAALLYSLIADDEARKMVGTDEKFWATSIALLRDGSAKCKAEALKALFVGAGDSVIREKLLQEDLQLISLLLSMVTIGMTKLSEDCLAVLALLACSRAGSDAVVEGPMSIAVLVYLVKSGASQRVQENAVSVLLNVCRHGEQAAAQELLPVQTLIRGLQSLRCGGSERGKEKAEALLSLLGIDHASSPAARHSNFSEMKQDMGPSSMPLLPRAGHGDSTPLPSAGRRLVTSASTPISASSSTAPKSSTKYISLARNLFNRNPRRRSLSDALD